jgi:hypothetical protein
MSIEGSEPQLLNAGVSIVVGCMFLYYGITGKSGRAMFGGKSDGSKDT